MKVFDLCCDRGHAFEGWFDSEADFDAQRARGILDCPVCSSSAVRRTPSAPRLNLGAQPPVLAPSANAAPNPGNNIAAASGLDPVKAVQMHAMLIQVAREIAANTVDVGDQFADEARKIHYGQLPERAIRGTTSAAEASELADEGIQVVPVPFMHLAKEPLQ